MNLYVYLVVFCYLFLSTTISSAYYVDVINNFQASINPPLQTITVSDMGVWSFLAPVINVFNWIGSMINWIYTVIATYILPLWALPLADGGIVWVFLQGIMWTVGIFLILDLIHGLI